MSKKQHVGKPGSSRHSAARQRSHRVRRAMSVPLWGWVALAVVAFAAVAILLLQPRRVVAPEITVAQAYEKYQAGVFLLDVRTQEEYAEGHVPNSVLIPLEELGDRLDELPRDEELVVICRSGNRSQEAAGILLGAGFKPVSSVSGGLKQWSVAGYPVEQ